MKKQTTVFVMVAVFVFAGFAARSGVNAFARVRADSREQLVGSWSLVSRVSTLANGEVLPDRGLATIPKVFLYTIQRATWRRSFRGRGALWK
jgi:hypothetical protein